MAGWGQKDNPFPGSCLREEVRGADERGRAKGLPTWTSGHQTSEAGAGTICWGRESAEWAPCSQLTGERKSRGRTDPHPRVSPPDLLPALPLRTLSSTGRARAALRIWGNKTSKGAPTSWPPRGGGQGGHRPSAMTTQPCPSRDTLPSHVRYLFQKFISQTHTHMQT